jgi:hypothetical protein
MCGVGALDFFKWCKDMNLQPYMQVYDRGDNKLYGDGMPIKRFKIFMSKLTYIFWSNKLCIKCVDRTHDLCDFNVDFSNNRIKFAVDYFLLDTDKKIFVNRMLAVNSQSFVCACLGTFYINIDLRGTVLYEIYCLKMFLIKHLDICEDVKTVINRFFVPKFDNLLL